MKVTREGMIQSYLDCGMTREEAEERLDFLQTAVESFKELGDDQLLELTRFCALELAHRSDKSPKRALEDVAVTLPDFLVKVTSIGEATEQMH